MNIIKIILSHQYLLSNCGNPFSIQLSEVLIENRTQALRLQ